MSLRALISAWQDLLRPRILGLVLTGVGLTLVLFVALQAVIFWAIRWFAPEAITLPWIGPVSVSGWLSWGSLALFPVMGFFLMAPVAAAFSGLFAERVATQVEAIRNPHHRGQPLDFWDGVLESLALLGLILLVGIGSLLLTPVLGPLAPLLFYSANGWLLGREFFQMSARMHLAEERATALRRDLSMQVTGLGVLIAFLLTVPVLNIVVPVLAAAGFTHLYHLSRISRSDRRG
ncbi:EI24 domain-containing protein [Paracoccus sp. DMF-8]|uniref:EI24 domain-containing protein n=1 Tax=Paracoccus sp. DMF-8 TaxID=3019445 RepID=UPI0023E3C66F|nr:EI24 domain-containing protein [Paracoccus sp. DMF-8]MDF3607424.1 EI24 domain-containing protein [Paracoccus sp. DMF-8]